MLKSLKHLNITGQFGHILVTQKLNTDACTKLHYTLSGALTARTAENNWVILDVLAPGVIMRFAGRRRAR